MLHLQESRASRGDMREMGLESGERSASASPDEARLKCTWSSRERGGSMPLMLGPLWCHPPLGRCRRRCVGYGALRFRFRGKEIKGQFGGGSATPSAVCALREAALIPVAVPT